jgi:hypothetical protein
MIVRRAGRDGAEAPFGGAQLVQVARAETGQSEAFGGKPDLVFVLIVARCRPEPSPNQAIQWSS